MCRAFSQGAKLVFQMRVFCISTEDEGAGQIKQIKPVEVCCFSVTHLKCQSCLRCSQAGCVNTKSHKDYIPVRFSIFTFSHKEKAAVKQGENNALLQLFFS